MAKPKYTRVMLKLSGELLMGAQDFGIDFKYLEKFAEELIAVTELGVELAVEIGGGNIYRWRSAPKGVNRNTADMMGMLGSVMSALNLRDGIEMKKGKAEAMSPLMMPYVLPMFTPRRARNHMQKGRVVVIGGGTGRQGYTTDSGAAEHALQLDCDVLLKATNVDGVYDSDPDKNSTAKKYDEVSFNEILSKNLNVMDMTAFALCRDNKLPIIVFDVQKQGNILKAVKGEKVGTSVI